MCNDYGNHIPYRAYVETFSHLKLPLLSPGPEAAPNLESRDEIWPSELAPVIRPVDGGVELVQLHWGLAPSRPKAPLVINMRAEHRNFTRGRCLVPASHYYEFTGAKSPKTRWRIARSDGDWFCFAGVAGRGRVADGTDAGAFALLTVAPGPDLAPYHDRQPVVLPRESWSAWLDPAHQAQEFLKPAPEGLLNVTEAPREKASGLVSP
jgi:putative SOS response-associated peptidase YedK